MEDHQFRYSLIDERLIEASRLKRLFIHSISADAVMKKYRDSEICQRLGKVEGIGPVTATALVAAVGDRSSFTCSSTLDMAGPDQRGIFGTDPDQ